MKKPLSLLILLIGCSTTQPTNTYFCPNNGTTCFAQPTTQTPINSYDFSLPCTVRDSNCLNAKMQHFGELCESDDANACYNRGLAQEEYDLSFNSSQEDPWLLQWFQKGCDKKDEKNCAAIKRVLIDKCDRENISIDRCSLLGDYEAKQGHYDEAEKIYKNGCDMPADEIKNHDACKGLVCIGYMKINRGEQKVGKSYFKKACESTCIHHIQLGIDIGGDGTCDGCQVIPSAPPHSHWKNGFLQNKIKEAMTAMPDLEKACKTNWSRASGPPP